MAFFISILSTGIYSGIINTISVATTTTCYLAKNLYINSNVARVLKQIDIERKLLMIDNFVSYFGENLESSLQNMDCDMETCLKRYYKNGKAVPGIPEQGFGLAGKDPIKLSLLFVQQSTSEIHRLISEIDEKNREHRQKWFYKWRCLNVDGLLQDLKTETKILDKRFHDMIRIAKIIKIN